MLRTGSRAVVSALMVAVQLLALSHAVVDEHALSGGVVVHRDPHPGAHAHAGQSLCEDGPAVDPSPCDSLALTRSTLLTSPVRGVAAFQGCRVVELVGALPVMSARAPLSWAPKASPPAAC